MTLSGATGPSSATATAAAVAERARAVALEVATAIRADAGVQRAVGPPAEDDLWHDAGLVDGYAGLALLAAHVGRVDPSGGWDDFGHAMLVAATRDRSALSRLGPSALTGWGGLAMVAAALDRGGRRYRRLLTDADRALAASALALTARVAAASRPLAPPLLDLVSGLAGAVVALVGRVRDTDATEVDSALRTVLSQLVGLARPAAGLASSAGWPQEHTEGGPRRVLNLGVAHGLPGVLGALSAAYAAGVRVPGQAESIDELAAVLWSAVAADDAGPWWPTHVPLDRLAPTGSPARTAWCYGAAGCARVLWLAGDALADPRWRRLGIEAFTGAMRRPEDRKGLSSVTFCHGRAGLAHVAARFAADTGEPELVAAARDQVCRLLADHDPSTRFGYRRVDRRGTGQDAVGLLDGAAGVATVLLAVGGDDPDWDQLFLVSRVP